MFAHSKFVRNYTLLGIALGASFPIGGIVVDEWLLRPMPVPLDELLDTNRLHYLVLLSPLVVGALFFVLGRAHEVGFALSEGKRQSDSNFKMLVNSVTDYAIYMLDPKGFIVSWNPGAERLNGYTADEILGKHFSVFYDDEDRNTGLPDKGLETALRDGKFETEGWRYRKDGTKFWAQVVVDPIFDAQGAHVGFAKITRDRTERKESAERIEYLAWHDTLTGLANRAKFLEQLEAALESARAENRRVAVINVDLDRFSEINDTRGHIFGDRLLQALSYRLKEIVRTGECIARFGGDEFVALKPYIADEELSHFIGRLQNCLTKKVTVEGLELVPEASFGVASFPQDGTKAGDLINNADLAMYRAKRSADSSICFYQSSMDEAARDRRAMARELRTALDEGQFFLLYQEQRCARTRTVVGYEALMRWKHPTRGLVSPGVFMPIAEESGAILPMGAWAIETACREAVSWNVDERIAVNVSPAQLSDVELANLVRAALVETGLSPSRLELEVTETAIMKDKGRALHNLRQLKASGVSIAIDDFGTGYSSLETLRSFPFDRLKLDRSFVVELEKRAQSRAILGAVLELGKCLNMKVLAEGVETPEQASILTDAGCDELQGYMFGRPAPFSTLRRAGPLLGKRHSGKTVRAARG